MAKTNKILPKLMIQLDKGHGHLLNLTWHPKCLDRDGRGICGLKLILECLDIGTKIVQIIKCYMTKLYQFLIIAYLFTLK